MIIKYAGWNIMFIINFFLNEFFWILILIIYILLIFFLAIMEKALSSWFNSPAEYRSLYLSYIFYLRRRLNNTDAETKLKRIEDIRSMLEQSQKFLLESMNFNFLFFFFSLCLNILFVLYVNI